MSQLHAKYTKEKESSMQDNFYHDFSKPYAGGLSSKRHRSSMRYSAILKCSHFYLNKYTSGLDLTITEARDQGHSDLETVGDAQRPHMYSHTDYRLPIFYGDLVYKFKRIVGKPNSGFDLVTVLISKLFSTSRFACLAG